MQRQSRERDQVTFAAPLIDQAAQRRKDFFVSQIDHAI